jgi:hypothetical protein
MNTILVVAAVLSLAFGHLMDRSYPMRQRHDDYVRSYFVWAIYAILFGLGAWLVANGYTGFDDYRY